MSLPRPLLWAAAACGVVHGLFSLYWAVGGRWLIETVGQWAVDWADRDPVAAGSVLALVASVKLGGAAVGVLLSTNRLPWQRAWRRLCWVGAVVLILYGAANTAGAWLVLSGVVDGASDDRSALIGHAALWDPLFLLWGVCLALGLRRLPVRVGR